MLVCEGFIRACRWNVQGCCQCTPLSVLILLSFLWDMFFSFTVVSSPALHTLSQLLVTTLIRLRRTHADNTHYSSESNLLLHKTVWLIHFLLVHWLWCTQALKMWDGVLLILMLSQIISRTDLHYCHPVFASSVGNIRHFPLELSLARQKGRWKATVTFKRYNSWEKMEAAMSNNPLQNCLPEEIHICLFLWKVS